MVIPSEKQLSHASWQKTKRSGGGAANCVQVAAIDVKPEAGNDSK